MIRQLYSSSFVREHKPIDPVVLLHQRTSAMDNGTISSRSEVVEVDNRDFAMNCSSTDFDIANLQAIGAFDKLKLTYMSRLSDMSIADKAETFLQSEPSKS